MRIPLSMRGMGGVMVKDSTAQGCSVHGVSELISLGDGKNFKLIVPLK